MSIATYYTSLSSGRGQVLRECGAKHVGATKPLPGGQRVDLVADVFGYTECKPYRRVSSRVEAGASTTAFEFLTPFVYELVGDAGTVRQTHILDVKVNVPAVDDLNMPVSQVDGHGLAHDERAASRASRTITERRFPVRAASQSSLALSSWGSRTVTDGECTPGPLSDGLPARRTSAAASTSSLTTVSVRRRPVLVRTSSASRSTSAPIGVSTVIAGTARMSASSQRGWHGVDDQKSVGDFDGDDLKFEAAVVGSDVQPSLISTCGDNRGGFSSGDNVAHVSLTDPVFACRPREPQLHDLIVSHTSRIVQDTIAGGDDSATDSGRMTCKLRSNERVRGTGPRTTGSGQEGQRGTTP